MRIVLLLLYILLTSSLSGQHTISGVISLEGEPAIGAHISVPTTDQSYVVDIDGAYTISDLATGEYKLHVTFVGAEDFDMNVQVDGDLVIDIPLRVATNLVEEITISAKSESRDIAERAIEIESVSIKEVSSRVKDVGEILTRLPGVNVRSTGSFGDNVDVSLNGLNGTAVRSFIDGMPMEFLYPQLSIGNIPVDNIKRVDVYKGVVPVDVGTDALGGGINLVTVDKHYNELKAVFGYGSFGTLQSALLGSYALSDQWSVSATANYNRSDNNYTMTAFIWEDREDGEIKRFNDGYQLINGEVAISGKDLGWADRIKGSVTVTDGYKELQHGGQIRNTAFGEVRNAAISKVYRLLYEKSLTKDIVFYNQLAYSDVEARFIDTTANVYSWSGEVIARDTRNAGELGAKSDATRQFDNIANRATLSYQVSDDDRILLSNLYASQSTVGRNAVKDIEQDFLQLEQSLSKNVLGIQYERELLDDDLIIAGGAKYYMLQVDGYERLSRRPISKNQNEWGYYITSKFNLSKNLFVRGSYESALRIPLFFQYFGNGINIASNIELQSETSDNINLGINWAKRFSSHYRLRVEANAFSRAQQDIIFLTNGIFQRYNNAEQVNSRGVELDVNFQFLKNLTLSANATKLKKTYGDIDDENVAAQFLEGTNFPNTPDFFVNTTLTYALDDLLPRDQRMSIYARYRHIDEFNFVNESKIYNPDSYIPVQDVIDAGINYKMPRTGLDLSLNANNLLGAEVFDNFSIPKPGRNYNFKIAYTLNNFNR